MEHCLSTIVNMKHLWTLSYPNRHDKSSYSSDAKPSLSSEPQPTALVAQVIKFPFYAQNLKEVMNIINWTIPTIFPSLCLDLVLKNNFLFFNFSSVNIGDFVN